MQQSEPSTDVSIYCRNSPARSLLIDHGNLVLMDAHSHVVSQIRCREVEEVSVHLLRGFPTQRLWIAITAPAEEWLVRPRRLRAADEDTLNLAQRIRALLVSGE